MSKTSKCELCLEGKETNSALLCRSCGDKYNKNNRGPCCDICKIWDKTLADNDYFSLCTVCMLDELGEKQYFVLPVLRG